MKDKRYVATFTAYVYASSDSHARSKAKMIANRQRIKYGGDWALEELTEQPFASLISRTVPL